MGLILFIWDDPHITMEIPSHSAEFQVNRPAADILIHNINTRDDVIDGRTPPAASRDSKQ